MPVIDWDSDEERAQRRRVHKASTVHGWLTKMRGTLLGSESTRRRGIREMKEARAIRKYKQEHPEAFRNGGTVLWIFPRRSTRRGHHHHGHHHHAPSNSHSHSHSHSRSHSHHRHHHEHDDRYRERHSGRHPFLHFHRRVRPHHHGVGTFFAGLLFGKQTLKEKGRYLRAVVRKERHKERHKRRRQRRYEAHDLKRFRSEHGSPWWHR